MERKNDSTILLLVAAGLGIYWYINSKKKPTDNVSTQPVTQQPVTETPTGSFSQEQLKEIFKNSNLQTTTASSINIQPSVKTNVETVTPVTDMFNTTMMTNYVEKTPIDAVYNMNIAPLE
jgi:hypothetical protein